MLYMYATPMLYILLLLLI